MCGGPTRSSLRAVVGTRPLRKNLPVNDTEPRLLMSTVASASASLLAAIDETDSESVESLLELDPLGQKRASCCVDEDGTPILTRAIFASNPKLPAESLAVVQVLLAAGSNPAQQYSKALVCTK